MTNIIPYKPKSNIVSRDPQKAGDEDLTSLLNSEI
jgi:hypothetical protein